MVQLHKFTPRLPTPQQCRIAWRIIKLAGRGFVRDHNPSWAAAIAYYSLLSLFPLLLVIGSIAAFFVDPQWAVQKATHYLGVLLPRGPMAIDRIVAQTLAAARGGAWFSIVPLLWSGSLVFGAVTKALNIVFKTEEEPGLWRRLLMRLTMLLTLGVMFLIALASPIVLSILCWVFDFLPVGQETVFQLVVNALPPIFVLAALFLSYRFVPQRPPDWRVALGGATLGMLLFATAKPIFLGYLHWLGRYNIIYGSLAGIIVIVLWTWVVAMIGLFGAQVAASAQAVFIGNEPSEDRETRLAKRVPSSGSV